MLAYLALCARNGVRVVAYEDAASGTLAFDEDGGRFTEVVLAPKVTVAPDADRALALRLHATAHERCFIARSCSVPVRHQATVTVAVASDVERADAALRFSDAARAPSPSRESDRTDSVHPQTS